MKNKICVILSATIVVLMLLNLSACSPKSGEIDGGDGDNDKIKGEMLVKNLGLCVTEGGLSLDADAFSARVDDYVALGAKSIRMDSMWNSPSEGVWTISDTTKYMLEISAEKGLLVKFLPKTVSAPTAWLMRDENSRMKDSNGRLSQNAVSYWYGGIYEFCENALRAQMEELKKHDLLDAVAALVVDMGTAGEPLYPPAWTQAAEGVDYLGGGEVFWCYGDNAVADFQKKMQKIYGGIDEANKAWGTSFKDFGDVFPPKLGEAQGQFWGDMLNWYIQVKRDFCDWQTGMYKRVAGEYWDDMPLILYLPGTNYTESDFFRCIKSGTAQPPMIIGADNDFTSDLAQKYGCMLQYTGLMGIDALQSVLKHMIEANMTGIPVFGENSGDYGNAKDPALLIGAVGKYGLSGLDFTHTRHLYETDGTTKSELYDKLKDSMPDLIKYVETPVPWAPPHEKEANPSGDILKYEITFDEVDESGIAYAFTKIASCDYIINEGDLLEYDLKLSADISGIGGIDGIIGGNSIRDNQFNSDQNGVRAHPNASLTDYAFGKWFHRELDVGNENTIGKKLTEIQLAAHPEQFMEYSGATVVVWYDNIKITNGGETKLVIFESAGDIDLSKVQTSLKKDADAVVAVATESE